MRAKLTLIRESVMSSYAELMADWKKPREQCNLEVACRVLTSCDILSFTLPESSAPRS